MRLFLDSAISAISHRLALIECPVESWSIGSGYLWAFTLRGSHFHISLLDHGLEVQLRLLKRPRQLTERPAGLNQRAIGPFPASLCGEEMDCSIAEIRCGIAEYWQTEPMNSVAQLARTLEVMLDVVGAKPAPAKQVSGSC